MGNFQRNVIAFDEKSTKHCVRVHDSNTLWQNTCKSQYALAFDENELILHNQLRKLNEKLWKEMFFVFKFASVNFNSKISRNLLQHKSNWSFYSHAFFKTKKRSNYNIQTRASDVKTNEITWENLKGTKYHFKFSNKIVRKKIWLNSLNRTFYSRFRANFIENDVENSW